MASNTKKTETQRRKKTQRLGKNRKRALAKKGTTKNEKELFGNVLKA